MYQLHLCNHYIRVDINSHQNWGSRREVIAAHGVAACHGTTDTYLTSQVLVTCPTKYMYIYTQNYNDSH